HVPDCGAAARDRGRRRLRGRARPGGDGERAPRPRPQTRRRVTLFGRPRLAGMTLAAALPDTYPTTRTDLHRLAVYVIAPPLPPLGSAGNGETPPRARPGGLGPRTSGGEARQIRGAGTALAVDERGEAVAREPVTTLARAAELVGIAPAVEQEAQFDVPPHGD